MKFDSRGFIGTTLFHILILIILLFFGFSYPDPPPEELGVLVNFGTEETGKGETEPSGDEIQGGVEETVPVVTKPEPEVKEVVKQVSKEKITDKSSQDFEEAPVKIKTLTPEEILQKEMERKNQEEIKKQKAEEERQRQLAAQWSNKGQTVFGNKGVGTTQGSEGITQGTGNQGTPEGTPGAENYGPGGGLGNGISFGLGDRSIDGKLPEPLLKNCTITSRVILKVQITVSREGTVVGEPKIIESNFQDDCIDKSVIEAAKKAKFNVDQNSAYRQQGWIRYIIEP